MLLAADQMSIWLGCTVSLPLDPASAAWFVHSEGNALFMFHASVLAYFDVFALYNEGLYVSSPVIDGLQTLFGVNTSCGVGRVRIMPVYVRI